MAIRGSGWEVFQLHKLTKYGWSNIFMLRGTRMYLRAGRDVVKDVVSLLRIVKILVFRALYVSDYQRWTNPLSLETWWNSRTEKIAKHIPKGAKVVEFGAGRRHLEQLLDQSCLYIPSDLTDRGPGTLMCDLNRRPLPDLHQLQPDVAVFAGVLEYVRDLEALVKWLSQQVSLCIASYAYVEPTHNFVNGLRIRLDRAYYGYMNSFTEEQLQCIFEKYGFACSRRETWTNQTIFVFVNSRTSPSDNVVKIQNV